MLTSFKSSNSKANDDWYILMSDICAVNFHHIDLQGTNGW